ncbi:methionyl-tRNA formyltransferase [Bacteroidia bacterium]|nr:methionyl-tRNA formyltransferase [Bacteroidia bacterium]
MKKEDLRIVYMGTPDFAVESLRALHESGYNVVGVITMPDKPAGRGHKIQFSPVKQYALDNHLRLLQPEKLKDEAFLAELKSLQADLQIVVAFRMLPEVVWNMPKLGTFNLHASLLPQYRGAAPINWAIINGERETGVTTFFLTHEIDTGNIILQEKTPISSEENAGDIHDRLMKMGGDLVLRTVDLILEEKAQGQVQAHIADLKPAPKIFKETCKIDWQKNTDEIDNFVRGLSPYPAAWTELKSPNGEVLILKIFETKTEKTTHNEPAGTLLTDGKKFIKIAVSDGYLHLISIQLPSKKRMSAEDVLRGFNFAGFEIF